jgi:transposase
MIFEVVGSLREALNRGCGVTRTKPWEADDELWAVIEPLLPKIERRTRHPGRKRHPDRLVFQGILFVLHTGMA